MLKPAIAIAFVGCLSLASATSSRAGEIPPDVAKAISLEVMKAGGRANLRAFMCHGDITPIEARVHDVIDRNINDRPDLKLRASHADMDDIMAEEMSVEFIRLPQAERKCDPKMLALAKDALEVAILGFVVGGGSR